MTVVSSPAVVRVEGDLQNPSGTWSFRNTYGAVIGLGDRIQNLAVLDSKGQTVAVRKTSPAEFKSEKPGSRISYDVRLSEPANPADGTHISSLNSQGGYLMLADVLPLLLDEHQRPLAVRVELQLPPHWTAVSSLQGEKNQYDVPDPARAVLFLGSDLKVKRTKIGATEFLFATVGEWPWQSESVTAIASKIIRDYGQKVGYELRGRVVLMLSPFPGTVGVERWSAETRGSSVVLLLGRNSARQVLLGRLSIVLTHELFHLFVPNALTLDGDYDWFFEGFTLYQALRAAVRLGFIDFQEYLATMARVYDSYRATPERDALSLIEATRRRWTATSSLVYDKGMLVAFLYDLRLRYISKNRQSLDDVYRELFREYSLGARRVDGNEAIITLLNRLDGNGQISKRYLVNPEAINLETELPAHGFTVETSGNHSCFGVSRTVNNEQREMLAALGYRKPRK